MADDLKQKIRDFEDTQAVLAYSTKVDCPVLGYRIYEQTCRSCRFDRGKYWLPLACHDLEDAALLGAFLNRWEGILEYLALIKDIKDLAFKIKDNYPPEWNEKFIEVDP